MEKNNMGLLRIPTTGDDEDVFVCREALREQDKDQ